MKKYKKPLICSLLVFLILPFVPTLIVYANTVLNGFGIIGTVGYDYELIGYTLIVMRTVTTDRGTHHTDYGADYTINIDPGGVLRVYGDGTWFFSGNINNSGNIEIESANTFVLSTPGIINNNSGGIININGTLVNNVSINNNSGGIINIVINRTLENNGSISNNGTINGTITGNPVTQSVTGNVTNASITNTGTTAATHGMQWTGNFVSDTGYINPASISVTIGGTAFTGFTYNQSTGQITIPAANVTGNIIISGDAIPNGGGNGGNGENGNGNGGNGGGETTLRELTVIEHFGTWRGRGNLIVKIDANVNDFRSLRRNWEVVDPHDYHLGRGSTTITLLENYLKTLENGTHYIRADFTDGYVYISLTVNRNHIPQTSDNNNLTIMRIMLFISITGIIGTLIVFTVFVKRTYGKKSI